MIMILGKNKKLYTAIKQVGPRHQPRRGGHDNGKEEDEKDHVEGGCGKEDPAAEYRGEGDMIAARRTAAARRITTRGTTSRRKAVRWTTRTSVARTAATRQTARRSTAERTGPRQGGGQEGPQRGKLRRGGLGCGVLLEQGRDKGNR